MRQRRFLALLAVLLVGLMAVSAALAQPQVSTGTGATPFAGAAHAEEATFVLVPGALASPLSQSGPAAWSNLLVEGFEGSFPGAAWRLTGSPTWGKTAYRKHTGSASVYAVGGGADAIAPPGPYRNNVDAIMFYGPFSLTGATAAEVSFYHWTQTEYTNDQKQDQFCGMASADGTNFFGTCYSGDWADSTGAVDGWVASTLDLDAAGILGQARVWLAFRFKSDGSETAEGSYLDDVTLRTWSGATPTVTPTPTRTPTATPKVCPGANRATFVTLEDNESNAGSGSPDGDMHPPSQCLFRDNPLLPIEFRIAVDPLPSTLTRALLTLRAWDVDEQDPDCAERDTVFFNSINVGTLTGANQIWSTTALEITPPLVRRGENLVQVHVNTLNCPDPTDPSLSRGRWCTGINWGQLVLGADEPASIRAVAPGHACYWPGATADIAIEVDTSLASQEVRVEVNILDSAKNNLAGASHVKTITGWQDDAFSFSMPLPQGAAKGDYQMQVIVYDTCSETQNAYRVAPLRIDPACNLSKRLFLPLILRSGG